MQRSSWLLSALWVAPLARKRGKALNPPRTPIPLLLPQITVRRIYTGVPVAQIHRVADSRQHRMVKVLERLELRPSTQVTTNLQKELDSSPVNTMEMPLQDLVSPMRLGFNLRLAMPAVRPAPRKRTEINSTKAKAQSLSPQ